jgi:hypothetical protein
VRGEWHSHVPGKQFFDAIDRVISGAFEHVARARLRVDIVERGCPYERVDRGGTFTPSSEPVNSQLFLL